MPTFDVHAYAVVRVKTVNVEAPTMEEAIQKVEKSYDLNALLDQPTCGMCPAAVWNASRAITNQHVEYIEYADEVQGYLVDVVGDAGFAKTRRFDADGSEVGTHTAEELAAQAAWETLTPAERRKRFIRAALSEPKREPDAQT